MKANILYTISFVLVILLSIVFESNAQSKVTLDKDGNYVTTASKVDTPTVLWKTTGKYFIGADGIRYAVCQGSKGGLFYFKTSKKTGQEYKVYIKVS